LKKKVFIGFKIKNKLKILKKAGIFEKNTNLNESDGIPEENSRKKSPELNGNLNGAHTEN
jgi:hypothetical protein